MEIFSKRLAELRFSANLSVYTLAQKIDVKPTSIHRWEDNRSDIKAQYLVRLARFFNVSTDYLLGITDRKEPYED